MKYPRILSSFNSTIWAIMPEKLEEIRSLVLLKNDGRDVDDDTIEQTVSGRKMREDSLLAVARAVDPRAARRGDGVVSAGGGKLALVPVFGVISQRISSIEESSGGVSTEKIGSTLDSLVADSQIETIILVFDTPGGGVAGVPELASKIYEARGRKNIIAIADSLAASAGFWLASQASEFYASPGALIGSVGVVTTHDDVSEAMKRMGVKTTYTTSSPFKAEGAPEFPFSDEAKASTQKMVDGYHSMFVRDLARGRGVSTSTVESTFGQGRVKLDTDAVSSRMADGITTLGALVRSMAGGASGRARMAATARAAFVAEQSRWDAGGSRSSKEAEARASAVSLEYARADEAAVARARADVQRQRARR